VLFFDGAGARASSLGRIAVRAAAGGSADDAILREIERSKAPQEIIVVTSDRELARRARDRGAQALLPEEFWSRVGATPRKERVGADPPVDVEEWLRYFEDPKNRK
jgi:predicted RNA-binding protein with PIN domain